VPYAGVLKSGYDTDNKIEVNCKSDLNGGTNIKATFLRAAADSITAVLRANTKAYGMDVETTVDGTGTITAKARKENVVDGVKVSVDTSLVGGAKIADIATPTVTVDYHKGDVTASASVSGSSLDASATFGTGDICIGAASYFDASTGTLGDPSLAASYSMGPTSFTGTLVGLSANDIRASVTHIVSDDIAVAGHFASKDASFSMGASYTIDRDSSVRAMINSDGMLNVGYARELTYGGGASINAGLEVDTNNIDNRKLGISMTLT
jgi:hypothetical protein